MRYLILSEKSSAAKDFAKALGGRSGHFDDFDYTIAVMHGHLLTLDEPQKQNSDVNFAERVAHWSDVTTIPWKLQTFKWAKTYIVGKDYRTGRKSSTKKDVQAIKSAATNCDALVIATDDDPMGEGDVLGYEIVEAIGWKKPVYRCRFKDQTPKSFTEAMRNLEDITTSTDDKKLYTGLARERFDYATMQLSRLATRNAREQSYDVVVRPGRLKSVIVELVYQQLRKRDTFAATDQFQAVFKDENNNVFTNSKMAKQSERPLAENDLRQLSPSGITIGDKQHRTRQAPAMMNFSVLSSTPTALKTSTSKFKSTYQAIYEAHYLSYPRTEDKVMTIEQWKELMPLVDPIAKLVGVDPSLLVNRQPRKQYAVDRGLGHGANRPGLVVPNSLAELTSKFGENGKDIYVDVAKSFLATMAADYEYDHTKAFVTDYPDFTASKNVMTAPGYETILKGITDDDDDENAQASKSDAPFGRTASPDIDTSKTTAPRWPNRKFVINYLLKNNVGTPATQVSTLSELADSKKAVLKETKKTYKLTPDGYVAGALLTGTMLASPAITKQLGGLIKDVGDGKIPMENIYKAVNIVIEKDRATMEQNAVGLDKDSYLAGKLPPKSGNSQTKCHGKLPDGTEVAFKEVFMGHRFTDDEVKELLAGKTIKLAYIDKHKQHKTCHGKLMHQKFVSKKDKKEIKYWGFKVTDWG